MVNGSKNMGLESGVFVCKKDILLKDVANSNVCDNHVFGMRFQS